jgi:16S rRNA processing protein RimM
MNELIVARIGKPHGLDGELLVRSVTADGESVFQPGRQFRVRRTGEEGPGETLTLEQSRPHRGGFLLRFAEIADRDVGRGLLGAELLVTLDELRPLEDGEFFLHDLVGLEIIEADGNQLGRITDVYDAAGQLLASVDVEGRERLFPVRSETVRRIDLEAGTIEVSLPVGLLEL